MDENKGITQQMLNRLKSSIFVTVVGLVIALALLLSSVGQSDAGRRFPSLSVPTRVGTPFLVTVEPTSVCDGFRVDCAGPPIYHTPTPAAE